MEFYWDDDEFGHVDEASRFSCEGYLGILAKESNLDVKEDNCVAKEVGINESSSVELGEMKVSFLYENTTS